MRQNKPKGPRTQVVNRSEPDGYPAACRWDNASKNEDGTDASYWARTKDVRHNPAAPMPVLRVSRKQKKRLKAHGFWDPTGNKGRNL